MGEYNCRCRPIPFFDDPKYDTPQEVYDKEKKEWSQKTYDEWKIDKNIAFISGANPQSKADLQKFKPELEKRMSSNDYRILGHNIGMKPGEMAEDVVRTLDENFFYSKKRREYTFNHIYRDHILGDISKKTGKKPFTLSEVLIARKEGIHVKYKDKFTAVWRAPDNRVLRLIFSRKDLKIVTAYRISKNEMDKILREGEKFAR